MAQEPEKPKPKPKPHNQYPFGTTKPALAENPAQGFETPPAGAFSSQGPKPHFKPRPDGGPDILVHPQAHANAFADAKPIGEHINPYENPNNKPGAAPTKPVERPKPGVSKPNPPHLTAQGNVYTGVKPGYGKPAKPVPEPKPEPKPEEKPQYNVTQKPGTIIIKPGSAPTFKPANIHIKPAPKPKPKPAAKPPAKKSSLPPPITKEQYTSLQQHKDKKSMLPAGRAFQEQVNKKYIPHG